MTGSIDPTRPQFDAFKALPRDEPIHMLNLVRLRPLADYPPDHPNHGQGMTGLDAYRAYGRTTAHVFARVGGRQIWLVITEGWCGDAAQNVPAIETIAAVSDNIETRYILRDENPELMDRFLTRGTRSIPKVIVLDRETRVVLGTWGPRPAAAQELFDRRRAEGVDKPVILEELQRWYNADKGISVQREMAEIACKCADAAERQTAAFA